MASRHPTEPLGPLPPIPPVPRLVARCRAALRTMEGAAVLLTGGWGWIALLSVLFHLTTTTNPFFGPWGAVLATQGTAQGWAVATGHHRTATALAFVGCLTSLFQMIFYVGWALDGHPGVIILAWTFGVATLMQGRAFADRARPPDAH